VAAKMIDDTASLNYLSVSIDEVLRSVSKKVPGRLRDSLTLKRELDSRLRGSERIMLWCDVLRTSEAEETG
jgi:hypothetical protein